MQDLGSRTGMGLRQRVVVSAAASRAALVSPLHLQARDRPPEVLYCRRQAYYNTLMLKILAFIAGHTGSVHRLLCFTSMFANSDREGRRSRAALMIAKASEAHNRPSLSCLAK